MKITEEILSEISCSRHCSPWGSQLIIVNWHQAQILGVHYPLRKGWAKKLIGKEITEEAYMNVIALRNKSKAHRQRIADFRRMVAAEHRIESDWSI